MFVYSEKIIEFVFEIKKMIRVVLSSEVGLKVSGARFFEETGCFSYPISVVVYNDRSELGYFDPNFYELGFHERLMSAQKKELLDVIRHEIAHYLTFIRYGYQVSSHGPEFRALCLEMGWGKEVYLSTISLSIEEQKVHEEAADIFRKIQKLMALSQSSNQHESELAMIKSQQLLLKYNLKEVPSAEEKTYLKRILKQARKNGKLRAIAKILEAFFVSVVFHKAKDGTYLEILGSSLNIQIAEYVAGVLVHKLEDLWDQAQKEHKLKGAASKNSFFLGIAKGYSSKIEALQKEYETGALIVIEKSLERARKMAYDRLSSTSSRSRFCESSSRLGELAGKNLSINPALSKASRFLGNLLGFEI